MPIRSPSAAAGSSSAPPWPWPAACCSPAPAGGSIRSVAPSPTTSIDTRWPIKQVIYLMLENRSFDNLFGKFPGVNGATTGVAYGQEQQLIVCPDWMPGDLPHDRAAALNCMNGGSMDGFGGGKYGAVYGYSQFDEAQIPELLPVGEGLRDLGQLPRIRSGARRTPTISTSSPGSRAA